MISTKIITHNFLLRVAAAIPEDGLLFSEIEWLDDRLKWPEQPRGWLSHLRVVLRACVEAKLLVFKEGKYRRPRQLYAMPLPPVKLPYDKFDPVWPEQVRR